MNYDDLDVLASLAEIFGVVAIVGSALFALLQMNEFKRKRRYQTAADLCQGFTEPELARAITLLRSLPDGVSLRDLQSMDDEYQEAAQIVGMSFETVGLLVQKDIASFEIVQELMGGLMLMMWRKIEVWVRETRIEQNNPRFGEWVQWLAERLAEGEDQMQPAFIKYAGWQRKELRKPAHKMMQALSVVRPASQSGLVRVLH